MNAKLGREVAPGATNPEFIVTPTLKGKLNWPLTRIGVDEELADDLANESNINQVADILRWEWHDIPAVVQRALRQHGFTMSGSNVRWLEQRVWTIVMQELLDCTPEEIGIELRICNTLEEKREVRTINDLLNLRVEDLDGIANFGEIGKKQVMDCLAKAGFVRGRNIVWIKEQDTAAYQMRRLGLTDEDD